MQNTYFCIVLVGTFKKQQKDWGHNRLILTIRAARPTRFFYIAGSIAIQFNNWSYFDIFFSWMVIQAQVTCNHDVQTLNIVDFVSAKIKKKHWWNSVHLKSGSFHNSNLTIWTVTHKTLKLEGIVPPILWFYTVSWLGNKISRVRKKKVPLPLIISAQFHI